MKLQKKGFLQDGKLKRTILWLVFKFALPSIFGSAVIALYNLADAYFVSSLGKEAGAAVGVSFAIVALLQAVGFTLGIGGGVLISRALGGEKPEEANRYAKITVTLALCYDGYTSINYLYYPSEELHRRCRTKRYRWIILHKGAVQKYEVPLES